MRVVMWITKMRAELYWITDAPVGRLAIMPRPRAGDWLADELTSWQSAGVDVVVSLLADAEIAELGLQHKSSLCQQIGLTFLSCPIADRGVPTSIERFVALTSRLDDYLRDDYGVAVHCRMGIGRSAVVAACLLVKSGLSTAGAFAAISRARGIEVPDTHEQIEWVESVSGRLRNGRAAT
jgi:protein-tyrosine phosphatase